MLFKHRVTRLPEHPICVAGQSLLSAAAAHGRVNTVARLLKVEEVDINGRGLADPPICRAAARGHLDVVGLLVQQGARLKINEGTIASYDTALCIAVRDGDLEMVRVLLLHDQIDVNLTNRWLEDPLILAAKSGHLSIVNELLCDRRQKGGSLRRSLDAARDDCIRRAIRSRIEDRNSRQTFLAPSPRRSTGGGL
ncbi:hypothetical protein PENARI_c054G00573 [Penicillium arizonense]|uniref:Uncharacterized protein n=1 Tax=Penicillium arizonense TaxID=1835702 RepID=A0A1F5L1X7_PENAI|nr:hypothetical protein PENARI_c054G00573 [Penicillium arizonense]OGE47214.1 hypothetical protein PENARI_c054G00573 [Penicillium arizonense]